MSSSCAHWRRSLQLSTTGYALVSLTAAAAILRFVYLDSKSLWQDEAATAYRATETFGNLVRPHPGEDYMVLYDVVLRGWSHMAGTSEISLRLPSVIFAAATVPLVYALGAELVDRRVGLLAALLMAINVSCIQYAQEVRSYAMVGMLVTLSSLLFVRSIKRPSLARFAAYVMVGPWAAYAHLFAILILPAQWLSLFLFRVDWKTRFRLTVCLGLVGILSLPSIILTILSDNGQVSWIPASSAEAVMDLFATFAGVYWGRLSGLSWVLYAIYLAAIGIAVAGASERERPVVGFLLLSVVIPVGIVLVVSIIKPLLLARYLLICLPYFVLLAAMGIMRIKPFAVMVAIAALIVALSLSEDRTFYDDPKQDWRGAINFVATHAKPGDVLVVFPGWSLPVVDYYVDHLARPADFRVIDVRRFFDARLYRSHVRVWIITDSAHQEHPTVLAVKDGRQVTAAPHFASVNLALVENLQS